MKVTLSLCVALCTVSWSLARPEPPTQEYGVPPTASGGSSADGGYGYDKPGGGGDGGGGGGGADPLAEEANYSFAYEVKDAESGNDFGHMESRMGDVAMGTYFVLLPDSRMQKVVYTADKDGYKPVVTYEGEAKFGPGVGGGKTGGGGGGGSGGVSASYGAPAAGSAPANGGYNYRR